MDISWALNQTAIWWKRLDPDGSGGFDWEDPVEIPCRWELRQERIIEPSGEESVSRAKILLEEDVSVGDMLYLGDFDSIDDFTSASASPANITRAYSVRAVEAIPDIAAESFTRTVWL